MRYFTHYWRNEASKFTQGRWLKHAAGRWFTSRGVRIGDAVYVVTVKDGSLYLVGRMLVGGIVNQKIAEGILGRAIYYDREHLLAQAGSASEISFERQVSPRVVRQLRVRSRDRRTPVFVDGKRLDRQTFRNVRELTRASAGLLERNLRREGAR